MGNIDQSKTQRLNELHGQILGAIRTTVELAIEAGGILTEVKESLPHGQFQQWVEENTSFDVRTAQRYMKAHRNRDRIKNDTVSSLKQLTEDEPSNQNRSGKRSSSALQGLLGNNSKVRVTDQGIEFLEPLTFAEWEELMNRAAYLNPESDAGRWIVGDLLAHGELMSRKAEALQTAAHNGDFDTVQQLLDDDANATLRLINGIADEWPEDTKEQRERKREWLERFSHMAERSAAKWSELLDEST
jgi:hypothetical protein